MRRRVLGVVLALVLSLSLVTAVPAVADVSVTIEVSQPVQVTSNSHYERGQSIVYDGTNYWLFYGRSASVTVPYASGNPDVYDYVVYYKKASSVAGLASTSATIIGGSHNLNGYLGETGAAYFGGGVWAFAATDVGATAELYGWYTTDGSTWTEVGPIVSSLSDGQAHHDEVAFGGELWVVEGSGNFATMHSATPKTGGWSTPLNVDAALTGGLVHFFVDGTDLYLAINATAMNYIYKYNSSTITWDKVDENAPPNKYDPTLFKVDSTYVFAQAPWDGTKQYILEWSGATLDSAFFDTTSKMVTEGAYGSNPWVDMWPIGFTDAEGTSYLFFTSERNPDDTSSEIDGNIWYLTVDWNVTNDHYTYIQEAIDAATSTTINVAAGIYGGFTVPDTKSGLTILGAQANVDAAGNVNRGVPGDGDESVVTGQVTITADDVTLNGFKMNSSYVAVGYDHAHNVNISYNILENVFAEWGAIHLHGTDSGPSYHEADGGYIGYNTIIGAVGDGIWTVGNDNVIIEYNHIINSSSSLPGAGSIQALNHVGTGIVINGNTITNSEGKGINYWAEGSGVITNNVITNSTYEAIYTDVQATISGNQITGGGGYGVLVANGAGGSIVSGNTISDPAYEGVQSDVLVTIINNDISGGSSGIQLSNTASGSVIDGNNIHDNRNWGLSIQPSVTVTIIMNNQFTDNPYRGVMVWGDGQGSGIVVNFNVITGNGGGVESQRTVSPVDATLNWWGDVTGPYDPVDTDGLSQLNPGGLGDAVSEYVLYDPWLGQYGFVTGGGWIMSPEGAYIPDPNLSGKATFGFISKYSKGANVPTGGTEFNFDVANLKFHSDNYDWLVVAPGGDRAMYKGTGTIDGGGNFGFMLFAIDGKPDMFRIKIWDKATDSMIYDNQVDGPDGTVIGAGQIIVHTK